AFRGPGVSLPHMERRNGRPQLIVDDRPFLILGLQWDCDSCFSTEEMNPLFAEARRMSANTAALPVYWREIEPEPGRYEFTVVAERLTQTRGTGLRIVLLWFGTWKNASAFYAPDHVRDDHKTYRYAVDAEGRESASLCPTSQVTWQADRDALVALATYLRDNDPDHTVILLQIEHEAGRLGTARVHCATCNDRFELGGYAGKYGTDADECFSVVSFAGYIDRLAAEVKAVKNLPCYTNAWLSQPVGRIPGSY